MRMLTGDVSKRLMNQTGVTPETRALAERLVALEARAANVSPADRLATCRACEKLRRPLVTLTGAAGFSSLLTRALTLAAREEPALSEVEVETDGSLKGLYGKAADAHPVLVAYLLSLLITFIGETLTMELLHDVWPDLAGPGQNSVGKEQQ